MEESTIEIQQDELTLEAALLRHYDNFSAFHEDCAFLCDAFASLAATSENLDQCSVRGLERNASWLKYRIGEFKEDLKQIRSKCSDASD